jgi:hypothetical protein
VADVVRGAVSALDDGGGLALFGQAHVVVEDRIERDLGAAVPLAKNPEHAREPVGELEPRVLVGRDGEPDRGGGGRVGGAMNTLAEPVAQRAGDARKRARAADHVDPRDLGGQLRPVEFLVGRYFLEDAVHRFDGSIDERKAKLVEFADFDRNFVAGRRGAEAAGEIDGDATRRRVKALFQLPAVIEQHALGACGQRRSRDLRFGKREVHEHLVEIVAAETVDARGGDDFVKGPAHAQERYVEGAAAHVVDDDVVFLPAERVAVAVRVFEAGRGRLVEKAEDIEAGAPEGVEANEALCAVRIRRRGYEDVEGFVRFEQGGGGEVRSGQDRGGEGPEEPGKEVDHAYVGRSDSHGSVGRSRSEHAFERSEHRPIGIGRHLFSIEPEAELPLLFGDHRGERLDCIARLVREGEDRVIPAVAKSDHGPRRSEINSESHGRSTGASSCHNG